MARIDIEKLSRLVRQKRGSKNLRDTAAEIEDVSLSTLSRIEQGKVPDLSTFLAICAWLNVSPEEFSPDFQEEEDNHKDKILYHLRADKTLSPDVADTLQKLIEMAYRNSREIISTGK